MPWAYEKNGAEIYRQSFAIIRREAALENFSSEEEPIVVRMIHALGLPQLAERIVFAPDMARAARAALRAGAPILCDAHMVAEGVTRARLPANNEVLCALRSEGVAQKAAAAGLTRSAAAFDFLRPRLSGAVVAIGNAPTALFHLLNMLEEPDCPKPAAILGCPVGFVGAAESKEALMESAPAPFLVVRGRLGGSAVAAAALNALASDKEI